MPGYVTVDITLSCGHTIKFRDSPPKMGHWITCNKCLQDAVVVKVSGKIPPGPKPDLDIGWE